MIRSRRRSYTRRERNSGEQKLRCLLTALLRRWNGPSVSRKGSLNQTYVEPKPKHTPLTSGGFSSNKQIVYDSYNLREAKWERNYGTP